MLRRRPVLGERAAHERVADRHHDRVGRAGDRDLFESQDVGQRVGAAAAQLLRDHDPEEAELAHALHGGVGKARLPVALGRDGLDLLLGELPREALDHLLLVRQLEPHRTLRGQTLTSTVSPAPAAGPNCLEVKV